jgi:hypothetical protein
MEEFADLIGIFFIRAREMRHLIGELGIFNFLLVPNSNHPWMI